MLLDNSATALHIALGGATTTNPIIWSAQIEDTNKLAITPKLYLGTKATAADEIMVPAPGDNIIRKIHEIQIKNNDTATVVVSILYNNGAGFAVRKQSLTTGQHLVYNEFAGWVVN